MSKKLRYVIIFMVLAVIAAVAAWMYTFRVSKPSVASSKTDRTISADELLRAFETNEDSANTMFLDKVLLVSGMVNNVTRDSLGYSVYLKNNEDISGIMCSFDAGALDTSAVRPGSHVNIKGICTGYLMDVVINKCAVSSE